MRKSIKAQKPTARRLLAMVRAAQTPNQRLAAITACFLVESFPLHFKYRMAHWGSGKTLRLLAADMKRVANTCGSSGCIAGLTSFLFSDEMFVVSAAGTGTGEALLGLTHDQSKLIFTPDHILPSLAFKRQWQARHPYQYVQPTDTAYEELDAHPVQVGRVLTRFLRTGYVDWSMASRTRSVKVGGRWF